MTESPAIPVQLTEPEFIAFIFPHLSMPRRGPKCKLGYHRVFNLILWILYTGVQWKCLLVCGAGDTTAVIHYTTVYKAFGQARAKAVFQWGVAAVTAGIPLNLVQKWLGHAQLSTTAVYANAVGAEEKDIARRMWG
jgi:transposase